MTPQADTVATSAALLAKYAQSSSKYTVYTGKDILGPNPNLFQAWTTDVAQLKVICDTDPSCTGEI